MPPKGKLKVPEKGETTTTVNERTARFHAATQPIPGGEGHIAHASVKGVCARLIRPDRARDCASLTPRAQAEVWKIASAGSLPLRSLEHDVAKPDSSRDLPAPGLGVAAAKAAEGGLPLRLPRPARPTEPKGGPGGLWGKDRLGRDVGEYTTEQFDKRFALQLDLTAREAESRRFRRLRDRAALAAAAAGTRGGNRKGKAPEMNIFSRDITIAEALEQERQRRDEMAGMRNDLYGERVGSYAQDPEWDDVMPIAHTEPEAALAVILYPEEYAEAISYLRAVMVKKEYSPRCLRLTEHIIELNPSHYTVWLLRAANVFALQIALTDELAWLNSIALRHLKNYQIWHHRHLLVERLYPSLVAEEAEEGEEEQSGRAIARFVLSERRFLTTILAEDTKNYHVWSYRSYLVAKFGNRFADEAELRAIEKFIDQDVRNNSAWSHRFLVVFGGSTYDSITGRGTAPATGGAGKKTEEGEQQQQQQKISATDPDPRIPADVVERELAYARAQIRLAPQNQSAWNYLRGVLNKGSQPLASMEMFCFEFMGPLSGGEGGKLDIRSAHALDLLADVLAEKGDKEKADNCLRALAERWDNIRKGYWEWRRLLLAIQV